MRNARFWVFVHGSPVKLTLRPGQTLEHAHSWLHEEGWSSEEHEWAYPLDERECLPRTCDMLPRVHWETLWDGSDCDGRLTRSWVGYCELDDLAEHESRSNPPDTFAGEIIRYPLWRELGYTQRDYAAEAAGY